MPSIPATTPPPPAPTVTNVSSSHPDLYSMLLTELRKKINDAQLSAQNTLIDISERMDRLEKGKTVNTAYSTKDLTPSSVAPTSIVNVEFGMPPNYFAGHHHRQAPFGQPRPNRPDRSHRPVRPLPRRPVRSDRSLRPVRPVPWCWPQRPLPRLRQFRVRLLLAEQMNWRVSCRRIPPNLTANLLFHPLYHKMFGMI